MDKVTKFISRTKCALAHSTRRDMAGGRWVWISRRRDISFVVIFRPLTLPPPPHKRQRFIVANHRPSYDCWPGWIDRVNWTDAQCFFGPHCCGLRMIKRHRTDNGPFLYVVNVYLRIILSWRIDNNIIIRRWRPMYKHVFSETNYVFYNLTIRTRLQSPRPRLSRVIEFCCS